MSYRSRFNAYTTTEDGSIPDGSWSWPDMYPGGPASGAGRVPPQQQAGIVRPRLIRAMVEAIAAASVRMAPELTPRGSNPSRLALVFGFRLSDPPRHGLKEAVRDLRMLLQERLEVPLRDARECDLRVGGDGRASALVVEQRHLAERVARTELARLAGDGFDAHVPVGDDHEADSAFAPEDDLVPGGVFHDLHLPFDRAQLGVGDAMEQLGVFELGHGQILIPGEEIGFQAFFLPSRNCW